MKAIISVLTCLLTLTLSAHAEEASSERLEEAIEVEHFIVNWSPSGENLGRVIVYRCQECAPEIMTFGADTQLVIDEQPRPIEQIGTKADWSGLITVTNHAPNKIIKFTIY
ncbi:hypothetical protein ACSX1C_19640 [Pseudomonas sp. MBLB4123]|uniref:hypothetical protein n=1 Tax=Pseudomonas sp. MBLB4123 TaxID=3451557 RepID=UPI003F7539B3